MASSEVCYYATLGIEREADVGEIRRAYRRLAVRYHPDKNRQPGAEEVFKVGRAGCWPGRRLQRTRERPRASRCAEGAAARRGAARA